MKNLWVVLSVLAVMVVSANADTAFSDDFTDGNRDGWYKQAAGATGTEYYLSVVDDTAGIGTGPALFFEDTGTGSSYRKLVANTSFVELTEPNDYVTLSFDMRFVGSVASTDRGFRFGMHNSMTTVVVADEIADDTCDDDQGYYLRLDTGTGGEYRIYPDGTSPGIMGGSETSLVTGTYATLNDTNPHHIDFTLTLWKDGLDVLRPQWEVTIDSATYVWTSAAATPYAIYNQIDFASRSGNDIMFDNVTLTSNKVAANSPPAVDAGGYAIEQPDTAIPIDASYIDDGNPIGGPVTYAWTVVDPLQDPNVVFSATNVEDPTVTINAPGMYELQLEVNDGADSGTNIFYAHIKDASMFNTLQGHWKFDGNPADPDDYYYKSTLTVGTPTTTTVDAISGQCLSMALGDRLEFGKAIGADENMSVAFWAMPKTGVLSQTARGIVSKYPDDGSAPYGGWTAQWRAENRMLFRIGKNYGSGGGDNDVVDPNSFLIDEWVHIAAMFDAVTGTSTIYRNGVLHGTDTTTNVAFDPTTVLMIGTANWTGLVDEMYVYDYPLDVSEVRALYTVGGGNMPPLVTSDDTVVKGDVGTAIPLSVTIIDENATDSAAWEVVDKPVGSTVIFGSVTVGTGTASTTGTFDTIGDYTLRASATDVETATGTSPDFVVKVRSVGFDGLEARFNFNSGLSNTTGDVTYAGTVTGSAVITAGAGHGGSGGLVLDGTTGHVDYNAYLGAEEAITVMYWAKTTAAGLLADQFVVQKWPNDDSLSGWMTRIRTDDQNFAAMVGSAFTGRGADIQAPAALKVVAGTWVHLALTFDGTQINIYQDGVRVNSVQPGTTYSTADIVSNFVIGYRQDTGDRFFNGTVDEVRVYDSALTQAQIVSIFTADGGTLPTTCLSAALSADFDLNCYVNIDDLVYMAGVWLTADPLADIGPVADDTVNMDDFSELAQQWLDCVDPSDPGCL